MSRIIINNDSRFSDCIAIQVVTTVMQQGKVSKTIRGNQYCFATTFKKLGAVVYADLTPKGTHSFRVADEPKPTTGEDE